MKYTIRIRDLKSAFFVDVYQGRRKVAEFGWHGGDFEDHGQLYTVRGPYHGLENYQIFQLVKIG